jgi:PAS domain S-box-containing protein
LENSALLENSNEMPLKWLRENLEALLESASCGYVFSSPDGSIVKTNQALVNWTGLSKEELVSNRMFRDLFNVGGRIYYETNCSPLLRMQGFLNEIALDVKHQDGSITPILLNSEELKNDLGEVFLYRHTLFHISDRQKFERELLAERRKSEQAFDELHAEKLLREQFVATLTHDLRSPISAAKMGAQMILRKPDDVTYVQRFGVRILSSVERLDHMIQDLLDANSIRAGEALFLQMELIDLPLIIMNTMEDLITVHGERFVYKGPAVLEGYWNANGIKRIIENLSNNAIKYGSSKLPIEIKLVIKDNLVALSVQNFGNPIPENELKSLFELYKRSDSASTGIQKGWGLGLTLVQGVTKAHSGVVKVESSKANGTIFSVIIPLDTRFL